MYGLKSIVSRCATVATKQQLSKLIPVTILPSRNYADHQIPERLKDVASAKGLQLQYLLIFKLIKLSF